MPQNLKQSPKVARLELDEAETDEEAVVEVEAEIEQIERRSDAEYYQIALKYLKHGMKEKDIAGRLVSEGMSRTAAKKLLEQVAAENPEIGRSNAYILLGLAVVLGIPGIILFIMNSFNSSSAPMTATLVLIVLGGWFLYKGVQAYRKTG